MDRIDKAKCPNFVTLTMHQLASEDWDGEYEIKGVGKRPIVIVGPKGLLTPMKPSWGAVLDKMGQNLTEAMFGAEGTVPVSVARFIDDGNTRAFFVDVGSCMYTCTLSTS